MVTQNKDQCSLYYRTANAVVHGLSKLLRMADGSAKDHPGWDPYLVGQWEPVGSEVHAQDLEVVEGSLPSDLEGAYVRTGPNPKLPVEGGIHLFDGDGMIHAVRIQGGKASYCNRWVRTARLQQEERAGWPVTLKIGDYRGKSYLAHMVLTRLAMALGLLDNKDGLGTANTALAFHAGRLLALHEGDLPYALRIACSGLVETVARCTYGGKIQHSFTAHPKIDPKTGELFYFGYNVSVKPYCWYGWLDAGGEVVRDFPVPLPEPIMMHDCALTQNHVLLLDMPLVFDPKIMIKEGKLPFQFKRRPARIGVLPRHAQLADEIRWFTTECFMCFHTAAAWEEGSIIKLYLCTFEEFSLDQYSDRKEADPYLSEVVLDLQDGSTTYRRMPGATPGDFPIIPAHLQGQPARYAYVASMENYGKGVPHFYGVTKYDLQEASGVSSVVGQIRHGGARLGGEAYFVPRQGAQAEDDGYLLTFVTDQESHESELVVYDAASMSSKPLARVRVPQRVPSGFHCAWVTAEELAKQLP